MDAEFWIKAWEEGRTGFHQSQYNDLLLRWFPKLSPVAGQKVLVPLCGKSKDMLWLLKQDLEVHGIELYEEAVKAFFSENGLPAPEVKEVQNFTDYTLPQLTISCGDFFRFPALETFDFIYDRASLVALPDSMRPAYVDVLHRALKPGGGYLLLTFTYNDGELEGPPFSITDADVQRLYSGRFSIEKVETALPAAENTRLAGKSIRQNVYLLKRFPHTY